MLLLFVFGAIIEIIVWIIVAQFVSGWYVFFWFVLAFVLGLMLMMSSIRTIMPALQQMQMTGQANFEGVIGKRLLMAISGLLLAIPGLISDVFAVLILLPFTHKIVKNAVMTAMAKRQQKMMQEMMNNMGMGGMNGQNPFADIMQQMQRQQGQFGGDSTVIDGEAREVTPNRPKIDAPKK